MFFRAEVFSAHGNTEVLGNRRLSRGGGVEEIWTPFLELKLV